MIWIKINLDESGFYTQNDKPALITIRCFFQLQAPFQDEGTDFRLSPIFPLLEGGDFSCADTVLHMLHFGEPFRVLGKICEKGSEDLRRAICYSAGHCSIILFAKNEQLFEELISIAGTTPLGRESWTIKNNIVNDKEIIPYKNILEIPQCPTPIDYSNLSSTDKTIVDEFYTTLNLLWPRQARLMPSELAKLQWLTEEVNDMVEELVFLASGNSNHPHSLPEYTAQDLADPKLRQVIRHQNIDHIIQINSTLSYVSTQSGSGALPILERRSLIRRFSFLGIGSAIGGLNSIAHFIENALFKINFFQIITVRMARRQQLPGLDIIANYNANDWNLSNVDQLQEIEDSSEEYYKLPYFSGRLGFRETQFSIAAALQSVSGGAGLEWSLMTLTHEMMHGHVRMLIGYIFKGAENQNPNEMRSAFFECFQAHNRRKDRPRSMLDSIRNLILMYCCMTTTHGSLSKLIPNSSLNYDYKAATTPDKLWELLEREQRNISEIFVHVIDFHYFYSGRTADYIPLIWCSWSSIPHVYGDLRQYMLRSLLAIASKEENPDPITRFGNCVDRFRDLLAAHKATRLQSPIISDILDILSDKVRLENEFFPTYKASLVLVDLVVKVFLSGTVQATLLKDNRIELESDETNEQAFEDKFVYDIGKGFQDTVVASPVAYIFNRMCSLLRGQETEQELEAETICLLLAIQSNMQ